MQVWKEMFSGPLGRRWLIYAVAMMVVTTGLSKVDYPAQSLTIEAFVLLIAFALSSLSIAGWIVVGGATGRPVRTQVAVRTDSSNNSNVEAISNDEVPDRARPDRQAATKI